MLGKGPWEEPGGGGGRLAGRGGVRGDHTGVGTTLGRGPRRGVGVDVQEARGSAGLRPTSRPGVLCGRERGFPAGCAWGSYGFSEAPAARGFVGFVVPGGEGGPRLPGGLRGGRRLSAGQSGGQRRLFRLRHSGGGAGWAGCAAAVAVSPDSERRPGRAHPGPRPPPRPTAAPRLHPTSGRLGPSVPSAARARRPSPARPTPALMRTEPRPPAEPAARARV